MRKLTEEQLRKAPDLVQIVHFRAMMGNIWLVNEYLDAIERYPWYFPQEVRAKKKYAKVPKEVHQAYYDECTELQKELGKMIPNPHGLIFFMEHPEDFEEYSLKMKEYSEKLKEEKRKIHQKHYKKYGIKYFGI